MNLGPMTRPMIERRYDRRARAEGQITNEIENSAGKFELFQAMPVEHQSTSLAESLSTACRRDSPRFQILLPSTTLRH